MRLGILTNVAHNAGSFRLRADLVSRELRGFGHQVYVGPTLQEDRDVLIRTKLWSGTPEALQEARDRGQAVIFDLCDDHSSREGWADQVRQIIQAADLLTVGSPYIANLYRERFGRDAAVIEDAYEEPEAPAVFNPGERLKVLWFGHASNAKPLLALAPEIEKLGVLRTVCNVNLPGVDCRQWSPDAQEEGLSWCDVVVIPVNREPGDKMPNGLAKTAARVVGALRRGRFPITERIDSYEQFEKWIWLGGIIEGLEWVQKQDRWDITQRISTAQAYVRANFSPRHVARQWERACVSAMAARKRPALVKQEA
jgi:hypothetical protein